MTMTREERYEKLQRALDHLAALEFPESPEDDALANWILDLAEIDAHYAGLAQTALHQGQPGRLADQDLARMRQRLDGLSVTGEDEEILAHCRRYLAALQHVAQALRDLR